MYIFKKLVLIIFLKWFLMLCSAVYPNTKELSETVKKTQSWVESSKKAYKKNDLRANQPWKCVINGLWEHVWTLKQSKLGYKVGLQHPLWGPSCISHMLKRCSMTVGHKNTILNEKMEIWQSAWSIAYFIFFKMFNPHYYSLLNKDNISIRQEDNLELVKVLSPTRLIQESS